MEGFDQNYSAKIGVLILNLGTPDNPDKKSLKKYLKEFLSDRRVVDYNRFIWFLILNGIILNVRPKKSAKLYKSIWTDNGSPLMNHMIQITDKLKNEFGNEKLYFELGMRYGSPSIKQSLNNFKDNNINKILVFPLYPQAGSPTSSSTFDEVSRIFSGWPWVPNFRFVNGYHDRDDYIEALSKKISLSTNNCDDIEMLIFSFHGMPVRYLNEGDPYYCFCHKTARMVAENLKLEKQRYSMAFQSRFGREEWLQPYIDEEIIKFAQSGLRNLHVISPGFSVDCLETLEEIQIQYEELFISNGGQNFSYIPCLNSDIDHINVLKNIINENIIGW